MVSFIFLIKTRHLKEHNKIWFTKIGVTKLQIWIFKNSTKHLQTSPYSTIHLTHSLCNQTPGELQIVARSPWSRTENRGARRRSQFRRWGARRRQRSSGGVHLDSRTPSGSLYLARGGLWRHGHVNSGTGGALDGARGKRGATAAGKARGRVG